MKILTQTGFHLGWKPIDVSPETRNGDFYGPRYWQKRSFHKLKDEKFSIVNAPMGSGKSWLMCLISAHKLQKDPSLRCIIAVPQTIIASGFEEANLLFPGGKKLEWFCQHDLCKEKPDDGTVNSVIKFLEGPYGFFQDRILVCTHATIVAVYKKIKKEKRFNLLHNLMCWIDEAHRLKNVMLEDFDATVSNGIGEFAAHLVCHSKNSHLGLATATFFRGDRLSLLTEKLMQKFVRFDLPYDEYLASMKHLKSFQYDFLLCDSKDYTKAFGKILKTQGRDIVHIPNVNSKHSTGCKYKEVQEILKYYKKRHNGKIKDHENGLTVIDKKRGAFKIIDLVDEDRRQKKKEYITSIKGRKDLDAIIALGMFKEGANWIWADRSIIVGPRASLVEVVQIIGRLFRDAEDKESVRVIHLLPFAVDRADKEKVRKNLNDYLKCIYASLILENVLKPITIVSPKKKSGSKKSSGVRTDWLGLLLPDENKQKELIEEVVTTLTMLVDDNEPEGFVINLFDEYKKVVPEILESYGITENIDEVGNQVWGMFARKTLTMQGLNVEEIDFEALREINPLEGFVRYSNGTCGFKTLKEFRNISCNFLPFDQARNYVRKLGLTGKDEYLTYHSTKNPPNLPYHPERTYRQWVSWGNWVSEKWQERLSFDDAKILVHKMKLQSQPQWRVCQKPAGVPANPDLAYKEEWQGWGDWLGTFHQTAREKSKRFLSYNECKKKVHDIKLKSFADWREFSKTTRPKNIPGNPPKVYSEEWEGWGEFLGTGNQRVDSTKFVSYVESQKVVKKLGLSNCVEYIEWHKKHKPTNMPFHPERHYPEWKSWQDFMGENYEVHKNNRREFKNFDSARRFARSLNLSNFYEWHSYAKSNKKPHDIPSNPQRVYKEEWKGMGDWLGTGNIANHRREFLSFKKARQHAQKLNLNSITGWKEYAKTLRPDNIPSNPNITYKKEWISWNDWLGKK